MASKTFSGIITIFAFFLFLPIISQGVSLIDINTAPSEELEKIIGIGPVLAQRTIEARPFNSLDDLIKVKGIGEITLQKIKDQGLAWVDLQEELEPKPEPEPEQEPDEKLPEVGPPTAEAVSYPAGVVFSEILPSPEGPDAENEWIEIFNQNNFEVNISGWKIKDKEGKITIYTFSAGTKISTLGYLVLKRPETKITLNNSGEGLDFIYPNGEIADSVTFGKASVDQSYNRTPIPPQRDWAWSSTLTPGAKNIVLKSEPSFAKASEGKKKSEDGPLSAVFFGKETDDVGEKLAKSSGFFSNLSIAFGIAILSAIIILFLKKRISPKSPF